MKGDWVELDPILVKFDSHLHQCEVMINLGLMYYFKI